MQIYLILRFCALVWLLWRRHELQMVGGVAEGAKSGNFCAWQGGENKVWWRLWGAELGWRLPHVPGKQDPKWYPSTPQHTAGGSVGQMPDSRDRFKEQPNHSLHIETVQSWPDHFYFAASVPASPPPFFHICFSLLTSPPHSSHCPGLPHPLI